MTMMILRGAGSAPAQGVGGAVQTASADFVNNIYLRNGTPYATYQLFKAAGGSGCVFSRASTKRGLKGGAAVAVDVPFIDVDGYLLETAATNLVIQSNAQTGWFADAATINVNALAAPDGTTTAARSIESGATGTHGAINQQGSTPLLSVRYVQSAYGKRAVGTRDFEVYTNNSGFTAKGRGGASLSNGAVTVASTVTGGWTAGVASAYAANNGFYRVANSFVAVADASLWLGFAALQGASESYTGDTTSAITMAGMQLEVAAAAGYFKDNPSSLIDTTTGAVTRAADVDTEKGIAGKTNLAITLSDATVINIASTPGATLDIAGAVAAHVAANVRAPVVTSWAFT